MQLSASRSHAEGGFRCQADVSLSERRWSSWDWCRSGPQGRLRSGHRGATPTSRASDRFDPDTTGASARPGRESVPDRGGSGGARTARRPESVCRAHTPSRRSGHVQPGLVRPWHANRRRPAHVAGHRSTRRTHPVYAGDARAWTVAGGVSRQRRAQLLGGCRHRGTMSYRRATDVLARLQPESSDRPDARPRGSAPRDVP